MAKDRKKLIHIHSSIADKQPAPQSLEVGEIAVNNSADKEFLSLKNSDDKVVRFSSDGQIIEWMERKEVMPYVGYVRGGAGPSATSAATPTADSYGSYGIQTSDLTGNTSEIVIKLNQVAASATTKHDRVNGSKDRYNKDVNPTTDGGVNDGAGFFIDMSRYAMQGANPTFSGITNTCYTNLNGTTKIKGVNGACGSLLDITVNSAKTDVETANTEITSATTVIGTNATTISGNTTLSVSGTTTETKKGKVTETNLADKQESTSGNSYNDVKLAYSGTTGGTTTEIKVGNVTESHSGTTTETKKGNVTEHNLANKSETTDASLTELVKGNNYRDINGNYSGTTGGTTTEVKTKAVSETNLDTTSIVRHSGVTEDNKSNVVRTTSGTTTETFKGQVTENNQSDYTVNTTGNVIENTTGTTTIMRNGVVSEDNKNNVVRTTSGTTTETFKGQVTENNQSGYTVNTTGNVIVNTTGTTTETKVGNVTENHSGTTTDNNKGNVTVNNQADYTVNTTGNTTFNTTGTTTIQSTGDGSDVIVYAKDDLCETSDDVAAFKGANTTNIGSDCTNANQTKTLNVRANSADTRVTSAYTSATTATTVIGAANTSATTATLSGNTLDITEAIRLSAKTPSTYVSGTSLSIVETNTDIESCGRISGKTNAFTIQECATGSGKTVINQTDIKASGNTLSFDETTSISAKTPTTTLSGTNLTVNETTSTINSTNTNLTGTNLTISESNTSISSCTKLDIVSDDLNFKSCTSAGTIDFDFCNGFNVNSNTVNFEQCSTAGTFTIKEKGTSISGETLTIRESGATDFSGNTLTTTTAGNTNINVKGNLTEVVTGTTNETHTGAVTITNSGNKTENTTGAHSIYSTGNTCINSQASANFYGSGSTNIGVACNGTTKASATTVYGTTTTISANTLNETSAGNTNVNVGGNLTEKVTGNTNVTVSGSTVIKSEDGTTIQTTAGNTNINTTGNTNITSTGTTTLSSTGSTTIEATGEDSDVCISAIDSARVYGKGSTYVGVNCAGTPGSATTVEGTTLGLSGNTTNISGATTLNLSGKTVNVDATDIDVDASNNYCLSAATKANIYGKATNIGIECGGGISTATTIEGTTVGISGNTTNVSGATTLNLSGKTVNVDATDIDVDVSNNYCLSAATKVNIYGKTTNIGVECGGTTATTINISGTTINEGGTTNNNNFATINNNATNFNITGVTNISGNTTIKGDLDVRGYKLYLNPDCPTAISSDTVNSALCEVLDRSVVTMTRDDAPSDSRLSAIYKLWQNDSQIGYDINVPKDGFLKEVKLVENDNIWYLRFTWNVYDAETQTYSTGSTDVNVEELVKDIEANNGKADRGANTNVWYNNTTGKMNVSADTTVKIATDGNGTKTFTKNAGEHSLNSYKLTLTHNGLSNAEFDPFKSSTALTLPHSALTAIYGQDVTGKSNVNYDTSSDKTIYIPTSVKNLSNWNGSCYEFDGPLCVAGTITASGAIYSSDRNLKDNINFISLSDIEKIKDVKLREFTFKHDESNRKVYGVIAQEVQENGLNDLIHVKEDGFLGVDYTSLLILKVAYLESELERVNNINLSNQDKLTELIQDIQKLKNRVEDLEGNR